MMILSTVKMIILQIKKPSSKQSSSKGIPIIGAVQGARLKQKTWKLLNANFTEEELENRKNNQQNRKKQKLITQNRKESTPIGKNQATCWKQEKRTCTLSFLTSSNSI